MRNAIKNITLSTLLLASACSIPEYNGKKPITPLPVQPNIAGNYRINQQEFQKFLRSNHGSLRLKMEKRAGATEEDQKDLFGLIQKAKKEIKRYTEKQGSDHIHYSILNNIDQFLSNEGFKTSNKQDLLYVGLRTKEIDCDLYTSIYLSIADILNFPLKAVEIPSLVGKPGHAYILWLRSNDEDICWETTNGSITSKNYYEEKYSEHLRGKDSFRKLTGTDFLKSIYKFTYPKEKKN